ncbi:hypothetical protein THIOM_005045 [Candidatus Thiomargarita nelsonii]|uniref:Uncharacterized protein n=1 Tax=Candidatus Thiomargarita nelsonii TaxID=1003181 RepID=A0A176RUB3_9GAMM|nr:hypothetical protein THIOM_005045 [Candidatus Thiomargarita nelsonii]
MEERYNREKAEAIDALLNDEWFKNEMLATEQAEFLKQKIEGTPALYNRYLENGFDAPLIKNPFRHFVANKYLSAYKDLETWCEANGIDLENFA